MKGILISIFTGIAMFFILVFIQEYETFLLPVIDGGRTTDYERLKEESVASIKKFNEMLIAAYDSLDQTKLDSAPATEAVKDEFKFDINTYIETGEKIVIKQKDSEIKDFIFLAEDSVMAVADETWVAGIKNKTLMEETNYLKVSYTLFRKENSWIITDVKVPDER